MSRIIAGSRGGQRLTVPGHGGTRPTTDRVREAGFSVIGSRIGSAGPPEDQLTGLAFLDLYAGSGAVALEAASRGAAPVTCVESDARARAAIRRNAEETRLRVGVVSSTVTRFLEQLGPAVDIVWLDPPYDRPAGDVDGDVARLAAGRLRPGALVVVERSARSAPVSWPQAIGETWNRRYGETTLYFGIEGAR